MTGKLLGGADPQLLHQAETWLTNNYNSVGRTLHSSDVKTRLPLPRLPDELHFVSPAVWAWWKR